MFFAALVENQLGNRVEAMRWLTDAVHKGYSIAEVNAAGDFDNLHDDPAFHTLVQPAEQKS